MGREAVFAALSWLSISGALAVNSFVFKDQQGAGSSRLYRQAGVGAVYASAAPYGAYSFHIPTYSTPSAAASRVIPVKETLSLQNANGYLKDSYGNRFVEALQSMKSLPFKPFPQQYVQLQELPAHFAQPLTAGAPPPGPAPLMGAHYRLQAAAPTPLNHQFGFAHPGVYADTFKNLAPVSFSYGPQFGSVIHVPVQSAASPQNYHKNGPSTAQDVSHPVSVHQKFPSAQQQSTSHKASYADTKQRGAYHEPLGYHKNGPSTQDFSHSSENQHHSAAQQQLKSDKAVYANSEPQEQYHHLKDEHKFQRLQDASQESSSEEDPAPAPQVRHKVTTKQIVSAIKETPIPTVVNGKKTVVNVKTKPPLPLLDINLLEPLTFANPLVPQVQHFLPRINEATYHKLPGLEKHSDKTYQKDFVVQKTKTYDSGIIKGIAKKPKKKQKSPEVEHGYQDEYIPAATARPTVTLKGLDEAPEIIYEINSPNYKETYKEQAVKYNKETNSEPVHYTYGTNTHKEPVHYSYTHSSKEPVHIQEVHYEGKGEGPKHLIYNFKPEEHNRESEKSKTESEDSSEHSEDDGSHRSHHRGHKEHHSPQQEAPKSSHHYVPEQREQEYHHKPNPDAHHNVQHREQVYHHTPSRDSHHDVPHREQEYHNKPHSDTHHNIQHEGPSNQREPIQYHSLDEVPFQPVEQYEEDISLTAPIKVDPNQHVQPSHAEPPHQPRSSPAPQHHSHPSYSPQHYSETDSNPHHETPSTHVHEKTKQVYIKEETPEDDDTVGEQLPKSMFGKEEDKEQDFEKAYKNSAFGFPAYDKSSTDVEKDIYDPEGYGAPHHHNAYDIEHSPFQQYQAHGDDFPKEMRLGYRDERDKMKEDYFLDYSVSKPESLVDRYKNKVNYYKLYKNQKPEKYVLHGEDSKNQQKQSAKLTAIPYSYYPVRGDNMKQFFAQYKATPLVLEYDYSKGVPTTKDNSAHASRPFLRYKMNTHFVEPQFQYGFEPIAIPRLLDSELAAMASNNSPESEKPGTRKKIYKENFYIKKMSMSDAGPNR